MKWGMNGLGILMMLTLISAARAEPSGLLNDTGQTQCLNVTGTALEECTLENSGDDSPFPGQDGRYGRDAAAKYPAQSGFTKPGGSGGHGGFAFTPLDVNGHPIPLVGDPPVPAETPRCVWDRVTNLIWEVKTDDGGLQDKDWTYGWGNSNTGICFAAQSPNGCGSNNYIAALNAVNVCADGDSGSWRMPSRRELFSIAQADLSGTDYNYFKSTTCCWSSDSAQEPYTFYYVTQSGFTSAAPGGYSIGVNLVRDKNNSMNAYSGMSDNGDGTVTDTVTGLIWDQCVWGQSWVQGPACLGGGYVLTWPEALKEAVAANAIQWRGHNDWRIPNLTEIESLVNPESVRISF